MTRLGLLSCALALAGLAACASPSEMETQAAARTEAAVAVAEPAPVEASTQALPAVTRVAMAPEDALVLPITYQCEGDRSFIATFPEHGTSVTIAAAGETRVLAHKGANDAAMFTDGSATLTADGAEATLTGFGAAFTACVAG